MTDGVLEPELTAGDAGLALAGVSRAGGELGVGVLGAAAGRVRVIGGRGVGSGTRMRLGRLALG